jgi:uncharacterized protein YcfJ
MIPKILSSIAFIVLPLIASATEYQTIERPRQQCWNERVPVQSQGSGYGGAVIGGIAGGLLGNQVGGGNGRTVATAIGAATGAIAGDRIAGRYPASTSYQTVQRCKTVIDYVRVPVVYEPVPIYEAAPAYQYRTYYIEDHPKRRHERWKHHRHDDDDEDYGEHGGGRGHGDDD